MQDHTALFVDDEVNILKALQRLLRNEPIDVLTANNPTDAFELIERADRVSREQDARALGRMRRALENRRLDAAALERARQGEAGESGTDDEHP